MSDDDQTEDSDAQDTRVVPGVDVGHGVSEGTLEMDRNSLLARLQADRGPRDSAETSVESADVVPEDPDDMGRTMQVSSVEPATQPNVTVEMPAAAEPDTKHYRVPAALMEQLADDRHARTTTPFSDDQICEFQGTIDEHGRIVVPAEILGGRFKLGSRVMVVMRLDDGTGY